MPERKDYYRVLQIEPGADLDAIKHAYRQQMRRHHPDRFVAERVRLQAAGDPSALHKLEQEMERAKQISQRINEAYGVLSDPVRRSLYDRALSEMRIREYQAEVRRQRTRYDSEDGRRTVKTRPHRPPASAAPSASATSASASAVPKAERFPWKTSVGFSLFLVIFFRLIGLFYVSLDDLQNTYVPAHPTAQGVITAHELQATTNADVATASARMTAAARPTATPRPAEDNIRAAQNLYDLGIYDHAIDLYNRAIAELPENADLYYQRGLAYAALYADGDYAAAFAALADFDAALQFDAQALPVYQARGLLSYALWQATGTAAQGRAALADLQRYSADFPDDKDILKAIEALTAAFNG